MKKTKAETAATRQRIVEIASKTFKTNGIHATGVSEIMAAAGLTHGGFYRHFESKEQLVAEAFGTSMDTLIKAVEKVAGDGGDAVRKYLEEFLSPHYRDDVSNSCPLVAMGSELARSDAETRRAATLGFQRLVETVARYNGAESDENAFNEAILVVASVIGAVTISRIVDDPALSTYILETMKVRLGESLTQELAHEAKWMV